MKTKLLTLFLTLSLFTASAQDLHLRTRVIWLTEYPQQIDSIGVMQSFARVNQIFNGSVEMKVNNGQPTGIFMQPTGIFFDVIEVKNIATPDFDVQNWNYTGMDFFSHCGDLHMTRYGTKLDSVIDIIFMYNSEAGQYACGQVSFGVNLFNFTPDHTMGPLLAHELGHFIGIMQHTFQPDHFSDTPDESGDCADTVLGCTNNVMGYGLPEYFSPMQTQFMRWSLTTDSATNFISAPFYLGPGSDWYIPGFRDYTKSRYIIEYPTSVKGYEDSDDLLVYPNPSTGTVFVRSERTPVQVYDVNGRMVVSSPAGGEFTFERGTYFVKSGRQTKKLFIQ